MRPERAVPTTLNLKTSMSFCCVSRRKSCSLLCINDIGADKLEQLAEPGIMIPLLEFDLLCLLIFQCLQ